MNILAVVICILPLIFTVGLGSCKVSSAVNLKSFYCFPSGQRKPVSSYEKITINKNSRATLSSLRHIIRKNNYRKDLRMVSSHFLSFLPGPNCCSFPSLGKDEGHLEAYRRP